MSLLTIIITLLVLGVILWAINVYAAKVVDKKIIWIINIVVIVAVLIWLLKEFGVWGDVKDIKVGALGVPHVVIAA